MPTASLTVRYRPLRIGFVVKPGDLDALVRVATLNSLLWGGIYNPVLPAGHDPALLNQWVQLFSVDLLTPVGDGPETKAVLDAYPYLRTPGHFADEILFEDWQTTRLDVGVLDIIHVVDHYWDVEFRHKPPDFKSNYLLLDWADDDPCATLFAVCFGRIPAPDQEKLKYNFREAFKRGLRAEVAALPVGQPLPGSFAEKITPLHLTSDRLQQWGGSFREDDGIYIGRAGDFEDLVAFWNLRAAGTRLRYLPYDHLDRFHDYIQAWLDRLDTIPTRPPLDRAWITVHWRDHSAIDVPALLGRFTMQRQPMLCRYDPVIWNGLNVIPSQFYLSSQSVLANVDRPYERHTVSFALPAKPVSHDPYGRDTGAQHLAAVVSPLVEFAYPEHTLKPPPLRGLDEFLSREIAFNPWKLRVGPNGIAVIVQVRDEFATLYPVPHGTLLQKVFELFGIRAEPSAPGRLAARIIESMDGREPLEACRIFKVRGVRKLLKSLRAGKQIGWEQAVGTIGQEAFGQHTQLYIEPRRGSSLTPADVLNFLIKKGILRPRLKFWPRVLRQRKELRCEHCGLKSSVLLQSFEGKWRCQFCGQEADLAIRIGTEFKKPRAEWGFVRSGFFAKENSQEGALPVILTLLQLYRLMHLHNFLYSTALRLEFDGGPCEVDLAVLAHGRPGTIELGIGECKDEHGVISAADIDKLRRVWKLFRHSPIKCYLIFAKTAEAFTADEIALFHGLVAENIPAVLFTNRELEPYEPYYAFEGVPLPRRHAFSLEDMALNSAFIHLRGAAECM